MYTKRDGNRINRKNRKGQKYKNELKPLNKTS